MARIVLKATPAFRLPDGTVVPARRAQALEEPTDVELNEFSEPLPEHPPQQELSWWRRALGEDPIRSREEAHRVRIHEWEARRDSHEARRLEALSRAAVNATVLAEYRAHEELRRSAQRAHAELEARRLAEVELQLRAEGRERARALRLPAVWRDMDGLVFEANVAWIFRACGWQAKLTQITGDGGADIILTRGSRKAIVQCKAHHSSLGSPVLRDLLGTKIDFNADEAILCALESVTAAAEEFANRNNIRIMTAVDLARIAEELCEENNRNAAGSESATASDTRNARSCDSDLDTSWRSREVAE